MKVKEYKISGRTIHKIMCKLVTGVYNMMQNSIIHRDLKLLNILLHFPDQSNELIKLSQKRKN